jgi:probable rRNA maturation factor
MEILVRSSVKNPAVRLSEVRRLAERVLSAEGRRGGEVSVLLVGRRAMRTLNERYTGRPGSTDVLSFQMEGEKFAGPVLGDVYVCVDEARAEARALGETPRAAVLRLVIHGLLHLLGYDHTRGPRAAAAMEARQESQMRRWLGGRNAGARRVR